MPEIDSNGQFVPFDPGAKPSPKDVRDYQLADHHPEIVRIAADPLLPFTLPPAFSLRGYDPGIDNQGQLGSCTAFGSGNAHELTQKRQNLTVMAGSKLAQYYWTRVLEGTANYDSGCYVRDTIKVLVNTGYAPVEDWPYYTPNFRSQPSQAAYNHAPAHKALKYVVVPNDANTIKAVLYSGFAVIVGFTVYNNFFNPVNGIVSMPAGSVAGGHCVRLIGWDDSKGFEFANSWGTTWGAGGYAWLPYGFLPAVGSDFWMISEVMGDVPVDGPRNEVDNRTALIGMLQRGEYLVPDPGWKNGVGQHGSKIVLGNGADPNPSILIAVS